jgi:hypothetical protein
VGLFARVDAAAWLPGSCGCVVAGFDAAAWYGVRLYSACEAGKEGRPMTSGVCAAVNIRASVEPVRLGQEWNVETAFNRGIYCV